MPLCRATIEYDGSNYGGWQVQENAPSVQGALERALKFLTGKETRIRGAGRTDAGVHARGQTAAFPVPEKIPLGNLREALNSRLPSDIAVTAVREVADDFDPRRHCIRKQYTYSFLIGRPRPALDRRRSWQIPWPLSTEAMCAAAEMFLGEHDFTSFCNRERAGRDNLRLVERSEMRELSPDAAGRKRLVYYVEGKGFLYGMVRTIAGSLVEAGRQRFRPEDIADIMECRDRARAGPGAPPGGLCLEWTLYPGERAPPDGNGLF
ncbi:MAG: tRNA pseudouridine(38-40) synthase TruA [Planctomycetota bacterium]|jgi:tRNA pseudouridine38-40 synthase|nr:tRNA pseudouridine(38-40) synthase TruA [Planctomycetota bacterium]